MNDKFPCDCKCDCQNLIDEVLTYCLPCRNYMVRDNYRLGRYSRHGVK